jgi:hypothetical protein
MAKLVELNLRPDARILRQFGFIALGGFGLMAVLAFREAAMFRFGLGEARVPVAGALAGIGVLSAIFSLLYPKANLPIYVGLSVVFFPLGFVFSYVLLGLLFVIVIGPVSVLVRLFVRDPMNRGYDSAARSYWTAAEKHRAKDSYFRQF